MTRQTLASKLENLEEKEKERLRKASKGALPEGVSVNGPKQFRYGLALRKPGIKQILGLNPLQEDENDELEKYFRMKKERI